MTKKPYHWFASSENGDILEEGWSLTWEGIPSYIRDHLKEKDGPWSGYVGVDCP
jgi:hypothetical protein